MDAPVAASVVLPAYNEEDTIEAAVRRTVEALEGFLPRDGFEVIVAEDGCTDRTPEIAARLATEDTRVRHVHSAARLGRGQALTEAFRIARGGVFAYLDTDLATDLDHLEELVETVRSGDADIATGSRRMPGHEVARPAKRGLPSRAYNAIVRGLLGSTIRDHQCGFKAFDRAVLADLLGRVEDDHWFWDTEVLVRAQRAGYRVEEFPVRWDPQAETKVDLVRDVLGMGSQVLRTWWQLDVQPRITPRRSLAAGVLLALAAVALMTLYLDPGAVLDELERAAGTNGPLLAVAAAVYLASWPLRGARYGSILSRLGFDDRTGFLTGAVFISQTGNLVFPARAGDAVRAFVMKTRRGVPYPTGFASLAIERVFDLLTITALAGVVLVGLVAAGGAPLARLEAAVIAGDLASGRLGVRVAAAVGLLALLVVAALAVTARLESHLTRRVVGRLSDDSYAEEVVSVVEGFVADLRTVAVDRRAFAAVGLYSVAIWSIDVATAAVVLAAFEPGLAPGVLVPVCFFAVSVGNLAKVLPLSPGGIGLYEGAFTLLVVAITPLTVPLALGAAIVDHAIKNAVTVAGGAASMLVLNVSLTRAVEEGAVGRESIDDGGDDEAREAAPAEAD